MVDINRQRLQHDLQRNVLKQLANTTCTLPDNTPVILAGAGALYHGYKADPTIQRATQDIDLVIHSGDPKAGILQKFDKALADINKPGIAVQAETNPQFPGQMGEYTVSRTYNPEEQQAISGTNASKKSVHISCEMSVEVADFMVTPAAGEKSDILCSTGHSTDVIDIQPYNRNALISSKIGRTMMPNEMKATDVVDIYNMQKSGEIRPEDIREMRMVAANRMSHASQEMKEGMGFAHLEPVKENIAAITSALDGKTISPVDKEIVQDMLTSVHNLATRIVPDVNKAVEVQAHDFTRDEIDVFKKAQALPEHGSRTDYVQLRDSTYPDVVAKNPSMVHKKPPSKEALNEALEGRGIALVNGVKIAEGQTGNGNISLCGKSYNDHGTGRG